MTQEVHPKLRSPESVVERQIEIGRLIRSVQEEHVVSGKAACGIVHDWYDGTLDASVEFVHNGAYAMISVKGASDDKFRVDMQYEDAAVRWYNGERFLDVTRPDVRDTGTHLAYVGGILQRRLDNDSTNDQFLQIAHGYLMPEYDALEQHIACIAARYHESPAKRDEAIMKLSRRILHGSWWSSQRRKHITPETSRQYLDGSFVVAQLSEWVLSHPLYGAVPQDARAPVYKVRYLADEA